MRHRGRFDRRHTTARNLDVGRPGNSLSPMVETSELRGPHRAIERVGFFGPFGTFTEQAVRTQPDLAAAELVDYLTVPDVLDAVQAGDVDCGVVPIENSIEGVVNFTQDALAFDYDLLITRRDRARHRALPRRRQGAHGRRSQGRAVDPGGNRAVPSLPARAPAGGRGAPGKFDGRRGAHRRRGRRPGRRPSRAWRPSRRAWRPSATAST